MLRRVFIEGRSNLETLDRYGAERWLPVFLPVWGGAGTHAWVLEHQRQRLLRESSCHFILPDAGWIVGLFSFAFLAFGVVLYEVLQPGPRASLPRALWLLAVLGLLGADGPTLSALYVGIYIRWELILAALALAIAALAVFGPTSRLEIDG